MPHPPIAPQRRHVLLLAALSMIGPFAIDTIFPAFGQMGRQFGATPLAMQQSISLYLVAYAGMSIVHGPLSDALGRKPVILGGLVVFALASVGCALATSLPMLLAFRALQGLSAGVGFIVGRAIIRDLYEGDPAQRLMSQVTMIFGIAPAIAPVIGGWLVGVWRWPAIFWFMCAFAVLLALAMARAMPETHPPAARTPLRPMPLLRGYWTVLGNPSFLRLATAASLAFSALFLYIASAPAFIEGLLGLSERDYGWFFVPMIGGMMAGAFLSGRLAGRVSGVVQTRIGFACLLLASLANLAGNAAFGPPALPWAVAPMVLLAFGIGLVSPILTLAILDMYPRARGAASSVQACMALVGNALMAGLVSPMLSHSGLALAAGSSALVFLAWLVWRWEYMRGGRVPVTSSPNAGRYEPMDEL
ncbi:multidrug effflux MFS transporter [Thermomonas brevis]